MPEKIRGVVRGKEKLSRLIRQRFYAKTVKAQCDETWIGSGKGQEATTESDTNRGSLWTGKFSWPRGPWSRMGGQKW